MNAVTKEQQTALSLPQRAAVALGAAEHEIKLRELVKSSVDIIAVIDPAGREQAHRIGMTLKTARVSIEKTGKAAREDATAFSKAVIAEEKRLLGLIVPEEERVLSLRDQFDAAEQRRKDALIAAERARTDAIQARINAVRTMPTSVIGKTAAEISQMIYELAGTINSNDILSPFHVAQFEEFGDEFKAARTEALDALAKSEVAQLAAEAEARHAEEARKAAEKRAAEEAAAVAAQRAENERVANELAIAAKRLADQEAAQALVAKQLADKAAANLKADRDAQELAMRLEREKIAADQAKALAEIKAARDRLDAELAAQAKAVKLEADHADALIDNAQFDIDREAERVRKQAMADQHLADKRDLPPPESCCARDARINEGFDETPTDCEILDVYVENFGGTREQAIERLALFDAVVARADAEVMA